MSKEERLHGATRAAGNSTGRSRLHGLGGSQRKQQQRSAPAVRKPPEPLRRAVADCLSSSSSTYSSSSSGLHPHGGPSGVSSEAGRTLRDYLAASTTTDMAYGVLLEHTLAERDRSPAVVLRCVALLKRYLMRYIPKVQTLQQIDVFCANSIAECNSVSIQATSSLSNPLTHRSGTSVTSGNAGLPSLPAPNYASRDLVKSLNYVRSLVIRYIPRVSHPVIFSGASSTLRQSLPSLSSFLSRSFNSQLSTEIVGSQEPTEGKEVTSPLALTLSCIEIVGVEVDKYIPEDLFKWRWHGETEQQTSSTTSESASVMRPQDVHARGFLEVGAAALFVGEETKLKDQLWRHSDVTYLPDTGQLQQPSTVTTATSFASVHNHLKAVTASKRIKPGPHQVWMNVPVRTFHPRTHTLFQYRHYSEQQPLRLNPAEVSDVIAAVCLEHSPPNSNIMSTLKFSKPSGKPTTDVAGSVLIKLIIDMYMMDSGTAAPLTLFMLEDMLNSSAVSARVRVFDMILNLGVHAHLLEPVFTENPPNVEEKTSHEINLNQEAPRRNADPSDQQTVSSAIDSFESWLLVILHEILLLVVQTEEREEIVWASALSCLLYFICDRGKIRRRRLEGLDIKVIKAFLDVSRERSWSEIVHCKLTCILASMCYQVSQPAKSFSETSPTMFLAEQVDLLGGTDFICLEYARANLREEKQVLFLILLDYVLDQVNESSSATGGSTYSFIEVQPIATMLTLANAPEAFYIAIKHGVEGIGEILRRSVSIALSRSSNFECLNLLLDKITRKLDSTISSFTRLDLEFSYMSRISKSYISLTSIKDGSIEADTGIKVKLSWSTLHFLLHSERASYRHNGYIWLVELLLLEISEEGDTSICSNIRKLQQQIILAGSQDLDCSSVPIHVGLLCGLLNSKHNFVRWGFLFVLEKLLMRCKLILDENKLEHINSEQTVSYDQSDGRLEKAYALIDILSSGLALLYQKNETDRINILKICDMLFSQLALRLVPANGLSLDNIRGDSNHSGYTSGNSSFSADPQMASYKEGSSKYEYLGGISSIMDTNQSPHIQGSASMAALLLRGYAIVPMQLIARVPTSLLYWPLIELASAATDDVSLGVAVGSRGRGILPGASSDIRAALLLLLNCKCTADPAAFLEVGGKDFFRVLLDDTDSRVAYYSSVFLLKRMMMEEPEKYQRLLQNLIFKAQQSNNEKLLENPYLQMRSILQLLSDFGAQL